MWQKDCSSKLTVIIKFSSGLFTGKEIWRYTTVIIFLFCISRGKQRLDDEEVMKIYQNTRLSVNTLGDDFKALYYYPNLETPFIQ